MEEHLRPAEHRAGADWPLHFARRMDLHAQRLAVANRDLNAARGDQRQSASRISDRRIGEPLTGANHPLAPVEGEAIVEQVQVVAEASFVGGAPIAAEISSNPLRRPEPTRTYPAPEVWPVFTPFAQGAIRNSPLIETIRRGGRRLRRVALRESAILAKAGRRRSRRAMVVRSRALE